MDTDGAGAQPVSVEQVLHALQSASNWAPEIRQPAEQQLKAWEADAAPNFIMSLLRIAEQHASVDEVGFGYHRMPAV
jgi:hypothetical protein